MNTQKLYKKTSLMVLVVLILTAVFSLGNTHPASASSEVINDGKGCLWWQMNSAWFAICLQAATQTTGNIWTYEGNLRNPWKQVGVYDANYEYYFNYRGGYAFGLERSTGKLICPSGNAWVYSTTGSCTASPSTPYAIVGGNTIDSPITVTIGGTTTTDPFLYNANSRIVDTWNAPNCVSSYNGCR
jgi:hypothetical protein